MTKITIFATSDIPSTSVSPISLFSCHRYAVFPILSAAAILRLSPRQRIRLFLAIALFLQCFVDSLDSFLDRLVAGILGIACAYHLYGDDYSDDKLDTTRSNLSLIIGATLPWNPIIPIGWRVWVCRLGAPCTIVLVHRFVRLWHHRLQSFIEKLAYAGPYTFQVGISWWPKTAR